jgi:hypothetical protein
MEDVKTQADVLQMTKREGTFVRLQRLDVCLWLFWHKTVLWQ